MITKSMSPFSRSCLIEQQQSAHFNFLVLAWSLPAVKIIAHDFVMVEIAIRAEASERGSVKLGVCPPGGIAAGLAQRQFRGAVARLYSLFFAPSWLLHVGYSGSEEVLRSSACLMHVTLPYYFLPCRSASFKEFGPVAIWGI
jgi:hypothetical protein